jgi:hypothetical protein
LNRALSATPNSEKRWYSPLKNIFGSSKAQTTNTATEELAEEVVDNSPLNKMKRKAEDEVYNPEEASDAGDIIPSATKEQPAKRTKTTLQAKRPIRTSKNSNRSNQADQMSSVSPYNLRTSMSERVAGGPIRRPRGRPKKGQRIRKPLESPEVDKQKNDERTSGERATTPPLVPQVDNDSIHGMVEHQSADSHPDNRPPSPSDGGLDDILENPSPIKPATNKQKRRDQRGTAKKRGGEGLGVNSVKGMAGKFDDQEEFEEDENEGDDIDEIEQEPSRPGIKDQSISPPRPASRSWGERLFQAHEELERVGSSHERKTDIGTKRSEHPNHITVPGKRIHRRLELLIRLYAEMLKSKEANGAAFQKSRIQIAEVVDSLENETGIASAKRLHNLGSLTHAEELGVQNFLLDLYFLIFPHYFQLFKSAAEALNADSSWKEASSSDLESLGRIFDTIVTLVMGSFLVPKSCRPPKKTSYSLSKPIRNVLPKIKAFQKEIEVELRRRIREKEREKARKLQKEAEEARLEEDLGEEEDKRARMRETAKLQNECIEAHLNHPIYGDHLRVQFANLEKAEARRGRKPMPRPTSYESYGRTKTSSPGPTRRYATPSHRYKRPEFEEDEDEDEEDILGFNIDNAAEPRAMATLPRDNTTSRRSAVSHPADTGDGNFDIERVAVFPSHNNRAKVKEFSYQEKEIIIKILMSNSGGQLVFYIRFRPNLLLSGVLANSLKARIDTRKSRRD